MCYNFFIHKIIYIYIYVLQFLYFIYLQIGHNKRYNATQVIKKKIFTPTLGGGGGG